MPDLDLPRAAADYAAGELTPEECTRFEQHLRADDGLAREVSFWRDLRSGLHAGGTLAHGTCPDLSQTLLRRAALERHVAPARRLRLPRWIPAATAAAAIFALGFGFAAGASWSRPQEPETLTAEVSEIPASEPIAYGEDGSGLMPPPARIAWATWMPLSNLDEADASRPLPMTPTVKPWIGLWTRQARLLVAGGEAREAHLVVRIVEDSPAWKAGLRPGDMVVAIDACPIDNATCLGEHLSKASPGTRVALDFWSAADAAFRSGVAELTAAHE